MSVLIVDKNLFEITASKGAYIEKLLDSGERVIVVVFTRCSGDLSPNFLDKITIHYLSDRSLVGKIASMNRIFRDEKWSLIYSSRLLPNFATYILILFRSKGTVYFHINGLGRYFSKESGSLDKVARNLIKWFYKISEKRVKLIFQNYADPLDIGSKNFLVVEGAGVFEDRLYNSVVTTEEEKKFDFCFVSRLTPLKGINMLKDLARFYPDKSFVVVGDSSKTLTEQFPANVIFVGYKKDVGTILLQSRYFLFPSSYREGVPRSVLEALYIGLPVVVPNTAGCFGLASYGNGEIFDNRSLLSLKAAVDRLLLRNYEKMSSNSKLLYNVRFSAKRTTDMLFQMTYFK